ncbi:uncharacterized protein FOMMEDRAFT_27358 [Fomitiporia mediterranea MF3/22]|uniref:uncharacterized protein n=1 Tax=Fomitiporia mediterranea (strain MF3/22) TaxID=694068 RepID=UPI0004407979|nr:uncharacterized protein FOMMEDRAFT_27358 [Fomitiporia mediterranea MF3/22]EJD05139.1 hypothetical protein FOMMEDRAFT_27358 [Fomitiporia mediterranea MF3/22]
MVAETLRDLVPLDLGITDAPQLSPEWSSCIGCLKKTKELGDGSYGEIWEVKRPDIKLKNRRSARFAAKVLSKPLEIYYDQTGLAEEKFLNKTTPQSIGIYSLKTRCALRCNLNGEMDLWRPSNLLFKSEEQVLSAKTRKDNGVEKEILVLGDFGIARKVHESKKLDWAPGTPGYISPEIKNENKFTTKADEYCVRIFIRKEHLLADSGAL